MNDSETPRKKTPEEIKTEHRMKLRATLRDFDSYHPSRKELETDRRNFNFEKIEALGSKWLERQQWVQLKLALDNFRDAVDAGITDAPPAWTLSFRKQDPELLNLRPDRLDAIMKAADALYNEAMGLFFSLRVKDLETDEAAFLCWSLNYLKDSPEAVKNYLRGRPVGTPEPFPSTVILAAVA